MIGIVLLDNNSNLWSQPWKCLHRNVHNFCWINQGEMGRNVIQQRIEKVNWNMDIISWCEQVKIGMDPTVSEIPNHCPDPYLANDTNVSIPGWNWDLFEKYLKSQFLVQAESPVQSENLHVSPFDVVPDPLIKQAAIGLFDNHSSSLINIAVCDTQVFLPSGICTHSQWLFRWEVWCMVCVIQLSSED